MQFVTVISPVRRNKKLFSYYFFNYLRNSTIRLSDSDNLIVKDADPDRNPTLIVTGRFIPRDSTRFHKIPP